MKILFVVIAAFALFGCGNYPSAKDLEADIKHIDQQLTEARQEKEKYGDGLLSILLTLRIETLLNTRAMLEQKATGINRFIPLTYSISGELYKPPENKGLLIEEIDKDLTKLRSDYTAAIEESEKYSGGLLQVLSLTKATTTENTIVMLEQRRMLLSHDIPTYTIIGLDDSKEPEFKATPGNDMDKF